MKLVEVKKPSKNFRRFKKNFNLFIYFSRLVSNPNTLNPTSNVRFGNILFEYLFFHYYFNFFGPKVPDQKFRLCQILVKSLTSKTKIFQSGKVTLTVEYFSYKIMFQLKFLIPFLCPCFKYGLRTFNRKILSQVFYNCAPSTNPF